MEDQFTKLFAWVTPALQSVSNEELALSKTENNIFEEFKNGWGHVPTIELFNRLQEKYGDLAGKIIEKAIALLTWKEWTKTGAREANLGTELNDFIKMLWGPLNDLGFSFTSEKLGKRTRFCVTKCPVFELAERTGTHKWLFILACSTDYTNYKAFSKKLAFNRTKTLIEGHDCCDHEYWIKEGS